MDLESEIRYIKEKRLQLRQILGGHTPAEFARLPEEERKKVYRTHVHVEDAFIVLSDGQFDLSSDSELANGRMLLEEYYMGRDEVGKGLVREARDIFYTENMFVVWSSDLHKFVQDTLADGEPVAVEERVRTISVRIEDEHTNDSDPPHFEGGGTGVAQDLRCLSKFTNATRIGIELWGEGTIDGMDVETQQKIKEIAMVIEELIGQFADKVTVAKVSKGGLISHDITSYWNPPTTAAKTELQRDKTCSFEELMQVQIEAWTGRTPVAIPEDTETGWEIPLL
jgi:hypothetical protein